ncbi:MAG TPA: prephenate dehydratase [Acidimicrobiales bacterium]|nr:prephenate dehydratase [Acidimicrobiales bacterium]
MRPPLRVGFLGPPGTFTEQALLTQADLADGELVAMTSIMDVLAATADGTVEVGFVPIENSIEGTVNVTLDTLAFETELLIQREVVERIRLNLLGAPGSSLADITAVVSMPHATAQMRGFLARELRGVETRAANSTAEAARMVGSGAEAGLAAVGTSLAAKLYGLEVLATDVEDHPENETRFVVVARHGVPPLSGHDKTTVVCFQQADRPGSLLAILQEFAARAVNLTKLESRPTKRNLGDYCFIIDFEGHVDDELVADCLRDLKAKLADVKFLGSYPAAGHHGEARRRDAVAAWRDADQWVKGLRRQVVDAAPEHPDSHR